MLLTTMTAPVLPTGMLRVKLCAGLAADAEAAVAAAAVVEASGAVEVREADAGAAVAAAAVVGASRATEVCEADAGAADGIAAAGAAAFALGAPFAAATA